MPASPVFVTLGPEGTNHALVARRYMAFHGLAAARLLLVEDFRAGLAALAEGSADYLIQAAAHPDASGLIGEAHFRHGVGVVDTFISPSRPLALLTRRDADGRGVLALQPATRSYIDTSPWRRVVAAPTIQAVAEGLLEGRYDSGLTAASLAEEHPDRFAVELALGTIDDPWIVFGKGGVAEGGLVAWRDSPLGRRLRR